MNKNPSWYSFFIKVILPIVIMFLLLVITDAQELVKHEAYTLDYNETLELSNWTSYCLTKEEVQAKEAMRTDDFREDPDVKTKSASPKDYEGTGFQRGHSAPAGDFTNSKKQMSESFYMSNMYPQYPKLNQGIMKSIELYVRSLAVQKNKLYIVTGPVVLPHAFVIGMNKVTVPDLFFKVIYDSDKKFITAFVVPNKEVYTDKCILNYQVSYKFVHAITNIDFPKILRD